MGSESFLLQGSMDGTHLQTRGWSRYQKIDEVRRVTAEDSSILLEKLSLLSASCRKSRILTLSL
jgi:hypothetical protein